MAIPVLGLCVPSATEEASVPQSQDLLDLPISGVCSLKPSIENAIHTNCGGCLRCLRIGKVTWLPQAWLRNVSNASERAVCNVCRDKLVTCSDLILVALAFVT